MRSRRAALLIAVALLVGCGGDGEAPPSEAPILAGFEFAESGVVPGQPIDGRFSCDGEDVSPPLAWAGAPEETTELALVVDDPDADGFTHWLVYAIPPDTAGRPARSQVICITRRTLTPLASPTCGAVGPASRPLRANNASASASSGRTGTPAL
jgi:Phosphatidylethanolamine-binding protein